MVLDSWEKTHFTDVDYVALEEWKSRWIVYPCNSDDQALDLTIHFDTHEAAIQCGVELARDLKVDFVDREQEIIS